VVTSAAVPVRPSHLQQRTTGPVPGLVTVPALYETTVRHVRTAPIRNTFSYASSMWLVDVNAPISHLPRPLRALARFEARDHLGDPQRSLRQNIEHYLTGNGIDLNGGRVLLLTSPRSLGHAFNPLSVWWCHHADGTLACVVAEVHNTYGERHAYLVTTDEHGRAGIDKAFYVSPFNTVDGSYRMSLPQPDAVLALAITLDRPGGPPFVATVRGRRRVPGALGITGLVLRHPATSVAVAVRIRRQGVRLWARRLPVINRPRHCPQEGVQ